MRYNKLLDFTRIETYLYKNSLIQSNIFPHNTHRPVLGTELLANW